MMTVEDRRRAVGAHHRTDIEGLRCLAVSLVVAFHVGVPGFSGGFIGVDVFFVISGYLITALLCRELDHTGSIRIAAFVARRIRRLLPAATVMLLATLALSALISSPLERLQAAASAQAAALYVSNIHFSRLASDYFSGDVRLDPLLHTWSLSVEEQFYLVWPWIILVVGASGAGVSKRRLTWCFALVAAASLIASSWYVTANHSLAFYGSSLRAWEFAAGGIAWSIGSSPRFVNRSRFRRQQCAALGWCGVVLVLTSAIVYSSSTEFPGFAAVVPVAGTAMILIAGELGAEHGVGSVGHTLSRRPFVWIGQTSYSWYLWHWPLLVFGAAVFPNSGLGLRLGLAGAALVCARISYTLVEQPTRKWGGVGPRPKPAILIGVAAAGALAAISLTAQRWATHDSHSSAQQAYSAAAHDVAQVYRDDCVDDMSAELVRVCSYGTTTPSRTIVLFGDSHAVQWFPALYEIALARGWRLLVIAKERCATADVPVYLPNPARRYSSCERWRGRALDSIRAYHPDVVVLSNTSLYIRGPQPQPDLPAVAGAVWIAGLRRTLSTLRSAGIEPVIISDTPHLSMNAPICLARSGWLGRVDGGCATSRDRAISSEAARADQLAVSQVEGSRVIDLNGWLCDATSCPAVVDGMVAYSDRDHLTATIARSLSRRLGAALSAVVVTQRSADGEPRD